MSQDSTTRRKIRPFDRTGNHTTVDNYVLDVIMPSASCNALRVLLFIIRKTVGWHEQEAALGFRAIQAGTGIGSRNTIAAAVKELVDGGYIVAYPSSDVTEPTTYALNLDFEADDPRGSSSEPQARKSLSKNDQRANGARGSRSAPLKKKEKKGIDDDKYRRSGNVTTSADDAPPALKELL